MSVADDDQGTVVRESTDERSRRDGRKTEKGSEYHEGLYNHDVKRAEKRLQNQLKLFDDLLLTDNVEMVTRELKKLDDLFDEFVLNVNHLRGLIEDNDRLCELSDLVDVNDNCIFEVKQKMSKWMILHAGIDGNSSTSRRTKSSRKSQTSHHSLSTKSSGSQQSNISQKSKIVGLKAEIEALKRSEEAKIEAKMIKMKVKAESFKMAQEAKLKAEVICLKGKIAKGEAIEKVQVEEEKIKIKRHGILDERLLNDSDMFLNMWMVSNQW